MAYLMLAGSKPSFFMPADNLLFDRIVKDGVEDDDALRRRDRPHGVLGLAEEVEVVEDLHRFGIPRRAVGRPRLASAPPPRPAACAAACAAARRAGRRAQARSIES